MCSIWKDHRRPVAESRRAATGTSQAVDQLLELGGATDVTYEGPGGTKAFAKRLAEQLEKERPKAVVLLWVIWSGAILGVLFRLLWTEERVDFE